MMQAKRAMASTAFKDAFKYYKSRQPPPDLAGIIDLRHGRVPSQYQIVERELPSIPTSTPRPFGVKPLEELRLCGVDHIPGFLILPNALTEAGQHYWLLKSLKDFSRPPNKCNLDLHAETPRTADSDLYEESRKSFEQSSKTRQDFNALPLYRLRWVTLGYNYHWDTKAYYDEDVCPFPADLSHLARYLASLFGYGEAFRSEAAIVNYYHPDSKLSGHTDHSEEDLDAPIVSVSLGLDAIFLLGGETLDETPTPIFLRSGDVMVLWKEARLAYHGVPRIFEASSLRPLSEIEIPSCGDVPEILRREKAAVAATVVSDDAKFVKDPTTPKHLRYRTGESFYQHYLKFVRVNVNLRQVKEKNGVERVGESVS